MSQINPDPTGSGYSTVQEKSITTPLQQKPSFWNLRRKLLIPSIGVMTVLALGMIVYIATITVQRNQREATQNLARLQTTVQGDMTSLQSLSLALATEMANNPQVQEALARQDRSLLTKITLPTFQLVQQEFDVKQYQFILPPATSFLRLHQLDNYGDDLSGFRFTVLAANSSQKPVSGIEIGRGGLGVRGEVPVFFQNKYVGIVDVGIDIGPAFLKNLKDQYGVDAQILLEKEAAQTATFTGVTSDTPGPTSNLLFQAGTFTAPRYMNPNVYANILNGESVISGFKNQGRTYATTGFPITDYSGKVIGVMEVSLDQTEILTAQSRGLFLSILFSLLVTLIGAYILAQVINRATQPFNSLTETAQDIASGNLERTAAIQSNDEIGVLANTFNSMTSRLRELIGSLEQRVAARTRNLELAAEVGRAVSQVRDLNVMLKDACELILKEFDLYYVQVYLSNSSQTALELQAGTGTVGAQLLERGHSLPFDTSSINGRAAVDQRTIVIADASQSAIFRKNPLLPETRGEMAVPLIVGGKVVGVLDMQSSKSGALTEEVLPAFEALAGQLAVAIQNANLLAEAEEARTEVEKQARRLVRAGWDEHLDAIHKPEKLGYVFDNNEIFTLTDTTEPRLAENDKAVAAPISVTGEALGSLVVELDDESRREQTNELVNLIARQVAQQIETLRLLESAERYRYEAEQAARRQTVEGWQEYMASRSIESLGYLYDTKEVRPQENHRAEEAFQFTLPLKTRDEMIGKLSVQDLNNNDLETVELVNAVAERLSAHIENLRLFEETRLGQVELDKRAQQLAAVAEITTVSSREFDVQKMLESVVHLTQRKFSLYHCHVFLYNEQTNMLKIAACGWKEGDTHEGTHGTTEIPLDQEQSLVSRAARTHQAVIINNVRNEPGWLPNPLLPDTAAELAVPLFISDRLLGVLDVQSDHVDAFSDEDANIQTTLASQVATALQNANSFNQAQSALTQSEKLFDASRRLTQATDLQHLVAETVALMNVPEVNRALLTTFDYDQNGDVDQLTIIGNWWNSTGHEITSIGTRYPREIIRVMTMFVSPVPVFFNDAFTDERVDATTMQLVKRLNLRAVAVLPLHLGTQQIGALILEAEDAHDFTEDEIRLFSALAPQIATVVENKRQFEKAQRQAERESMLNAIGQKIQSATSVEAVLQIAARELGRALSAPLTVAQLGVSTKTNGHNGN